MERGHVTTPFGRRPMTLALVRQQVATADIKPGSSVDKWKVFRAACAARDFLKVQDRSLAVLDALLSFYPESELRQDGQLIVFPSNEQLMVRAHGIAAATLRRHIAVLVDAGLIVRKDSANGKRYARKSRAGEVEEAYGFDLSPLLARAEELEQLAQRVIAERQEFRRTREALTICRRDVRKLISAAMEEGADGNWGQLEAMYVELVARIPRNPNAGELKALLDELGLLHEEVVSSLNQNNFSENTSANDAHFGRHIQNSNTDYPTELEPSSRKEQEEKLAGNQGTRNPMKAFPLGLVLRACPQILDYGQGGAITGWRDLMAAAVVVRTMLGVSPSAYQDACDAMGPENAAVAMACMLERAGHINSPGGYLRDLSRKAERGEFSLGPMVMALLRANGHGDRQVS
ncbi:replication initiation protein RepC [Neorhizobium sp. T786]|uniref:plasmid replication protein RepC n=1 Tax=Pseudorhizobium xiangyangii TaxID=2883104 RepID=UPI001CFF6F58|nr:plasmid replication protein RepC [Neorhizobium xiangyangii]MCB5203957.1 replication initiation protein RepC [Neorhizobium xiangyangii]